MGEASATTWSDEFRRTGQVVFTHRPRRLLGHTVGAWFCFTMAQLSPVDAPDPGLELGFDLLLLTGCLAITSWYGWQLITRRPILTVNHHGIRVGRRFLPWAEVRTIGMPYGVPFNQTLTIHPKTRTHKRLNIEQLTVKDLRALARWLYEVRSDKLREAGLGPSW